VGSFTDKDSSTEKTDSPLESAGPLPDASRRRFSRSAIAGSAVLLSLGNRGAWGAQVGCMSLATLNSFNPAPTGGTGTFMSAPGARPAHNVDLAQKIHDISNPPNYIGSAGTGTNRYCTRVNPQSLDGVCLYKEQGSVQANKCP
jgi:hypothetical protein